MNTYEPEFIGITNFSRIFVVDTEKTCWYKPETYAQPDVEIDITERRDKIGGGWKNRTTWQPPYLTKPTGLQPAIGNTLHKTFEGTPCLSGRLRVGSRHSPYNLVLSTGIEPVFTT